MKLLEERIRKDGKSRKCIKSRFFSESSDGH